MLEEGARERRLYVPRGAWVDVWRSLAYREGSGAFRLGRAELVRGGRQLTLPAPLDEIPLLARAGAILPLLAPDVDTLAGTAKRGVVDAAERRDRLSLLAFPRGRSRAAFGTGGRLRSAEANGSWVLQVDAPRSTRISLQASLATLRRPLRPCGVTVDGAALPGKQWEWNRRDGTLDLRLRAREARIAVRGC